MPKKDHGLTQTASSSLLLGVLETSKTHCDHFIYIQGVSGAVVNILGVGNMDYSE